LARAEGNEPDVTPALCSCCSRKRGPERRHPFKQAFKDFTPVDFTKHFVSSTEAKIVTDVVDTCLAIALDERFDTFQALASGIFAT
jgi:hypothetical protein